MLPRRLGGPAQAVAGADLFLTCRGRIYIEESQHGGDNTRNGPIRTRPRGAAVAPRAQGLDRQEAGMTQTLRGEKRDLVNRGAFSTS